LIIKKKQPTKSYLTTKRRELGTSKIVVTHNLPQENFQKLACMSFPDSNTKAAAKNTIE
jgi:hypothetical protein